jgi:hypothetical protein
MYSIALKYIILSKVFFKKMQIKKSKHVSNLCSKPKGYKKKNTITFFMFFEYND